MINGRAAASATGNNHTMSASIHPAKIALTNVVIHGYETESLPILRSAACTSLPNAPEWTISVAAINVPTRLAASTSDQSRITLRNTRVVGALRKTRTGVSVFSVKSC